MLNLLKKAREFFEKRTCFFPKADANIAKDIFLAMEI